MLKWLILYLSCLLIAPLRSKATQEHAGDTTSEWAGGQQQASFLSNIPGASPNIALKLQPAKALRFTRSQINSLLMDLRHEVKTQVANLEDEMAEEERRRQKTASTWSSHGAPIWVPKEARSLAGEGEGQSGISSSQIGREQGMPRFLLAQRTPQRASTWEETLPGLPGVSRLLKSSTHLSDDISAGSPAAPVAIKEGPLDLRKFAA